MAFPLFSLFFFQIPYSANGFHLQEQIKSGFCYQMILGSIILPIECDNHL